MEKQVEYPGKVMEMSLIKLAGTLQLEHGGSKAQTGHVEILLSKNDILTLCGKV